MSKKLVDKRSVDVFNLEFLNEHVNKERTQWNSSSSNEESFLDSRSEVLWSREKNELFSENDFFRGFCESFSDLTERSNSSCSWHNDDFDMNSSIKVKLSLDAIEDALYEQKQSNLISKTVFQECCEWAKKFSYFRLKGEQIVKPVDDKAELYSVEENGKSYHENSTSGLQIQGVKMAIHASEKHLIKAHCVNDFDNLEEEQDYFKENFDGDEEECFALDNRIAYEQISPPPFLKSEIPSIQSVETVQEKIVEKIAFEIWPKVLGILQKTKSSHVPDFQLPPIVTALQQRKIPQHRPKTEGTDLSVSDFPKLSSILTITPKILQNKQDYVSRSSRPNSEIHLSRRNYTVPIPRRKNESSKVYSNVSKFNKYQQTTISSSKQIVKGETDYLSTSSLLPALEEDAPDTSVILRGFSLEPEFKNISSTKCETIHLSKKSECFLPPIERKSPVPANVKLTRNLFTFFGTPLKFDKHEGNVSAIQPTSRPCTSVSRKSTKFSGNVNIKQNDGHSSIKKTSLTDMKTVTENNPCKQVTLFPIVTSLTTEKERNLTSAKRGLLNTFVSGKKR
ncbi:uncharacterized protein LOC129954326 isoform X2 [Argiope bruennichi]|uniref:uncharacterized protein LOC129954326 isoform X2 n=1 Tax=Argiope bruennichi TaxID=94029 RepID=UPI002494100C|nr:uncharacterized protein LOC129954326 isoform X2 [Argiope bruennichi]